VNDAYWNIGKGGPDLATVFFSEEDGAREAAGRLAGYVYRVTGAELCLEPLSNGAAIRDGLVIATESRLREWGVLKNVQLEVADSFAIVADAERNCLLLVGNNARGVLYAVNELLERYFDVRWLTPWVTHVPRREEVRIPKDLRTLQEPAFALRGFHICFSGFDRKGHVRDHYDEQTLEWMRANKMNMKFLHNDEFEGVEADLKRLNIVPLCLGNAFDGFCPKSLFDEHPEYFPSIGGARVGRGVVKRCLANPGFQEHFVEQVKAFLRRHRALDVVAIQPTDGLGWCECDACRATDTAEDRKGDTVSGRVYRFASGVAKAVREEFPEKWVSLSSYSGWLEPPADLKPIPNLAVALTMSRSFSHAIDDPRSPANRRIFERAVKFRKLAGRVMAYEYFGMSGTPMPVCRVLSRSLDALHGAGVEAYFGEIAPDREPWETMMLPLYLAARKTWDLGVEPDDCIRDFCRHYYRDAGEAMTDYHLALEEAFDNPDREYPVFTGDASAFLTRDVVEQCKGYLARAADSVEGVTVHSERVEAQRKLLDTWAEACRRVREKDFGPERVCAARVDGNEDPWRQLQEVEPVPLRERGTFRDMGTVRVGHDGHRVYLLFRSFEPNMVDVREHADRDQPLHGSRFDFFLCPQPSAGVYYQFVVNAVGGVFCQKCRAKTWDSSYSPELEIAVEEDDTGWSASVRIPAGELGEPGIPSGSTWRAGLNLQQARRSARLTGGWPRCGAFHDVDRFGPLVLR